MGLYLLLFITAVVYDIIVVLWFRAMAKSQMVLSATYAPLMVLIANFEAKAFVFDSWALLPLCLGTSVGTILGAYTSQLLKRGDKVGPE